MFICDKLLKRRKKHEITKAQFNLNDAFYIVILWIVVYNWNGVHFRNSQFEHRRAECFNFTWMGFYILYGLYHCNNQTHLSVTSSVCCELGCKFLPIFSLLHINYKQHQQHQRKKKNGHNFRFNICICCVCLSVYFVLLCIVWMA